MGSLCAKLHLRKFSHKHGAFAFCSPAQVAPFLNSFRVISVEALGLLTTAELPAEATAGAPVTTLRYPALYAPTQEAVLVQGSLLQLGDETVQLKPAEDMEVDQLETSVVKLVLYRDQCIFGWDRVVEAPLRTLIQHTPELSICKKVGCKQDASCPGFHPSVEEAVDQLVLDVWGRQFQRAGGGKQEASSAALFQAFIRVPSSAISHLHRMAVPGLFFEPRADDGSGPHPSFAVVWLSGMDFEGARQPRSQNM